MNRLLKLIFCLVATTCPLTAPADQCDNLRNNQEAYRDCVNDWYGTRNRGSEPTPWWKNYDPNAGSAPAEQSQNTGDDPYYARQREESERKAAAQREEQARRAKAESDAEFDKHMNIRMEASKTAQRWRALARVNALAAAATNKKTLAPADYSDLIVTAYPHWDLMHYWAEQAAQQYGGRFNLLLALTDAVGCPEYSQLELSRFGNVPKCNPQYQEKGLERMQANLKEAARVDRLMVCFKTCAWFREIPRYADRNSPESNRRQALYQACMASLGDIPANIGSNFVEAAFQARLDVYHPDHFLLFFHPDRERLGNFTDTAAIQKLVRESALMMKLLNQPSLEPQTRTRREAAAGGLNLDWLDKGPALVVAPGPAAQRHIDQARAQQGKPVQAAPAGAHRAHIAPRTDWADWRQTWALLNNMMVEYQNAGNPAMAAVMGDAALAFAEAAGPANNEYIHITLNKLAQLFELAGKHEPAEFLYRSAIGVQDTGGTSSAQGQAAYYANLVDLLRKQQRITENPALIRRALVILTPQWDKPDGPQSVGAAWALQRIGVLHRALGDYARAEEYFDKVLDLRKRILPADHRDIGLAYESKAILYRMTNRPAEADQMQHEADIIYGKRK